LTFPLRQAGDPNPVIAIGLAFIVVGIIFLFLIPWVGIPVGLVGLVLAILWVAGFGRRAVEGDPHADRRRV
jgi:Flp pilus assembly protein TadB